MRRSLSQIWESGRLAASPSSCRRSRVQLPVLELIPTFLSHFSAPASLGNRTRRALALPENTRQIRAKILSAQCWDPQSLCHHGRWRRAIFLDIAKHRICLREKSTGVLGLSRRSISHPAPPSRSTRPSHSTRPVTLHVPLVRLLLNVELAGRCVCGPARRLPRRTPACPQHRHHLVSRLLLPFRVRYAASDTPLARVDCPVFPKLFMTSPWRPNSLVVRLHGSRFASIY